MTATKLTPAEIEQFAAMAESAKLDHVFSEQAKALFPATLDYYDKVAIGQAWKRRQVKAAVEVFETTPAIRAYMLANLRDDSERPSICDLTFLAKAAKRTVDQYGKTRPAYRPQGDCPLRLCLTKAVRFRYSQQAYADYSTTLIPVKGEVDDAGLAVCQRNLAAFVRYADSHTGMAGSGCNYSVELVRNEHGLLAVLTCRASIAD